MDDNDLSIQKYLVWFDEVEKDSLFDDDDDWIFSDSDDENIMDQNEVVSTQPDTSTDFEYASDATAFNPSSSGYQYTNNAVPTYTTSETVVDSSVTTDCQVMPANYEYNSNFLAPNNFYGNTTYVSTQFQKVEEDNVEYSQYGQEDISNANNVYSNNVHNITNYSESPHETVIETKAEIVNEICVEDAKVDIKTEEQSQNLDVPHNFTPNEEVVANAVVKPDEIPQQVKSEPKEEPRDEADVKVNEKTSVEVQQSTDKTNNHNLSNGNKPVEAAPVNMCIRSGCDKPAINNPEWEQEFCSNECVIIHCKNVFTAWVKSNEVATK